MKRHDPGFMLVQSQYRPPFLLSLAQNGFLTFPRGEKPILRIFASSHPLEGAVAGRGRIICGSLAEQFTIRWGIMQKLWLSGKGLLCERLVKSMDASLLTSQNSS
jgi:hypothetical protein